MPRRRRLEGRGDRLEVLPVVVGVVRTGEHAVERLEHPLVREDVRVRLGQARQQPPLVLGVVEQHDLVRRRRGGELPPLVAVGHGDDEPELGRVDGGPVERDPALDERPEHREEAPPRAGDGRRVRPVRGHVAVLVEQVAAGHPHVVEPEPPVVDAVQPALEPVVLAADAGQELPRPRVADRHVEGVHPVPDAVGDELGEDHRRVPVQGGVAEVVLPGRPVGRVQDELLRRRVVRGGGGQACDVRAVARLGHRERTRHAQVHRCGQQPVVMVLGAQVHDRRREEPPLHARLDLQRRVGDDDLLEPRDRRPVLVLAAQLGRERTQHVALGAQDPQLLEDLLPVLGAAHALDAVQARVGQERPGLASDVAPPPEQHVLQVGDVHRRFRARRPDRPRRTPFAQHSHLRSSSSRSVLVWSWCGPGVVQVWSRWSSRAWSGRARSRAPSTARR